ncbi:hypothetical protein ACJX0J_030898, partial [Zea mays]
YRVNIDMLIYYNTTFQLPYGQQSNLDTTNSRALPVLAKGSHVGQPSLQATLQTQNKLFYSWIMPRVKIAAETMWSAATGLKTYIALQEDVKRMYDFFTWKRGMISRMG